MEVVEAAAQLQTLKFGGSGPGSAASPPPEERLDAEQAERALPAGEQPPPAQSSDTGGNAPSPSGPCATGPDAVKPLAELQDSDSSDSDSDSDRSSAGEPRGCRGRGTRGLGS